MTFGIDITFVMQFKSFLVVVSTAQKTLEAETKVGHFGGAILV